MRFQLAHPIFKNCPSNFSILAPTRGATIWTISNGRIMRISTPKLCDACDLRHCVQGIRLYISIHAPVRGATPWPGVLEMRFIFQLAHLMRGATVYTSCLSGSSQFHFAHTLLGEKVYPWSAGFASVAFQLTHPMRGATAFHPNHQWDVVILIPALRKGCDRVWVCFTVSGCLFQLTHPVWGATRQNISR